MPNHDTPSDAQMTHATHGGAPAAQAPQQHRSLFDIPAPLKRIFDRFPLVTYDENQRPLRAPQDSAEQVLHVFTTAEDAKHGRPSFNPGCLKWQAFLHFSGLSFKTVSSSNHASPSGSLPFLIPASTDSKPHDAVPSNKLRKFVRNTSQEKMEEPEDVRYEAYASLLDTAVRKAWLYQLYINPANARLMHELYVAPCSSNTFVQMAIAHQLRQAATDELAKSSYSGTVSEEDIFRDSENAFSALAELLGDDRWFFGKSQPSILDASIFAYTQLILAESLQWTANPLAEQLYRHHNLAEHRDRIRKQYF